VAKKRNQRRGWRGFGWDMFQLFDFARFHFPQMIAFAATPAPQSAPDCNCEFSLTVHSSKKLEKPATREAGQMFRQA
jgi:hypothetical protein